MQLIGNVNTFMFNHFGAIDRRKYVQQLVTLRNSNEAIVSLLMSIKVYKSNKIKSALGYAYLKRDEIRLHPGLFDQDDILYTELEATFIHELCHHAVWKIYGNVDSHGIEWKYTMWHLGHEPEVTHNAPTRKYRQRKFNRDVEEILEQLSF